MKYIVINIGCIECGVTSNIVEIFDKEKAEEVAKKCRKEFSWREGGQNEFEVFLLPKSNIINSEYSAINNIPIVEK